NVSLVSGSVVLRGTGGTPNADYQLLISPDSTLSVAQWTVAGSNTFDNAGNFICTNNASGGLEAFYRIRIGTNGSASPVGPNITGHPQSLGFFQGQNAQFPVTASSTTTMYYQWFFNTNTPIPFGTASILTITNASPANRGRYSVTVSNEGGVTA